MERLIKPFEKFLPGNHLILGEAGSGKTRLIWSILQEKEFVEDNSINIVLTDSEKRIWFNPTANPIRTINPYHTDISWVAEPQKPGIYYCACEYAPRVITFLECLSTWALQNEANLMNIVRVFVDFPSKYWNLTGFIEQLTRLHYISRNREDDKIEIWSVLGSLKKITAASRVLFENINLVLLNPFPKDWSDNICKILDLKDERLPRLISQIDNDKPEGFYYIPKTEPVLYQNENPIKKLTF